MALGKRPIGTDAHFHGDTDDSVRQLIRAAKTLQNELAITPGVAELVAGVTILAGQPVYIVGNTLYIADAATNKPAIGIAVSSGVAGVKIRFILGMGYAGGLAGLTANKSVYLGNAGALVYAIPGSGMRQPLGWSLSTTEMFVTIGQPF